VGYEPGRALGCLDGFEASSAFAFRARGGGPEFERDVDEANADFFGVIGGDQVFDYDVRDPMATFASISSLVTGLSRSTRVVIIPFGPKIFAAAAMLAAITSRSDAAVWRVSGEHFEEPALRPPTNNFCHFRVAP
jgi:hypothetical protein